MYAINWNAGNETSDVRTAWVLCIQLATNSMVYTMYLSMHAYTIVMIIHYNHIMLTKMLAS